MLDGLLHGIPLIRMHRPKTDTGAIIVLVWRKKKEERANLCQITQTLAGNGQAPLAGPSVLQFIFTYVYDHDFIDEDDQQKIVAATSSQFSHIAGPSAPLPAAPHPFAAPDIGRPMLGSSLLPGRPGHPTALGPSDSACAVPGLAFPFSHPGVLPFSLPSGARRPAPCATVQGVSAQQRASDLLDGARTRASRGPSWVGGSFEAAQPTPQPDNDSKQSQLKMLCDMFGLSVPPELLAEWEGRNKDKTKRALCELARAAKYGEPSPQFYPSNDQLRTIAAAARLGCFVPELLSEPEARNDRCLASYLQSLLPVAHGSIWQFRQTPATVLNEIGYIVELSLASNRSRLESERQGVRWSLALRERIDKVSQARPMQAGDAATFSQWQEAFMFAAEPGALPASLKIPVQSSAQGNSPAGAARKDQKDYCMWHLIYRCRQVKCGRLHECPICKECGPTRQAPLAWHLSQLKEPRKIVPANSSSGSKRNRQPWASRGNERAESEKRSRSRSRRRR